MEKSVVKKILINVMLLLFVAVNGSAQFITGSITDRQGLPVEFAKIELLSIKDSSFPLDTNLNASRIFLSFMVRLVMRVVVFAFKHEILYLYELM